MAASTKLCTPLLDLAGTGSTFDSIPFRSKHHIYKMPNELALPFSSIKLPPITRVTSPTKTCRPSKSSKIPDPNPPKENFAEVVGHEDTHLKQKVMVSGVDLDEFAEVQTGESVYERFMREESLAER